MDYSRPGFELEWVYVQEERYWYPMYHPLVPGARSEEASSANPSLFYTDSAHRLYQHHQQPSQQPNHQQMHHDARVNMQRQQQQMQQQYLLERLQNLPSPVSNTSNAALFSQGLLGNINSEAHHGASVNTSTRGQQQKQQGTERQMQPFTSFNPTAEPFRSQRSVWQSENTINNTDGSTTLDATRKSISDDKMVPPPAQTGLPAVRTPGQAPAPSSAVPAPVVGFRSTLPPEVNSFSKLLALPHPSTQLAQPQNTAPYQKISRFFPIAQGLSPECNPNAAPASTLPTGFPEMDEDLRKARIERGESESPWPEHMREVMEGSMQYEKPASMQAARQDEKPKAHGTSMRWTSEGVVATTRFNKMQATAAHMGMKSSPVLPKTQVDLARHAIDMALAKEMTTKRILEDKIAEAEGRKNTAQAFVYGNEIGYDLGVVGDHGKHVPKELWELADEARKIKPALSLSPIMINYEYAPMDQALADAAGQSKSTTGASMYAASPASSAASDETVTPYKMGQDDGIKVPKTRMQAEQVTEAKGSIMGAPRAPKAFYTPRAPQHGTGEGNRKFQAPAKPWGPPRPNPSAGMENTLENFPQLPRGDAGNGGQDVGYNGKGTKSSQSFPSSSSLASDPNSIWHSASEELSGGKRDEEGKSRAAWPSLVEAKAEGDDRVRKLGERRVPLPRKDLYAPEVVGQLAKFGTSVAEMSTKTANQIAWYKSEIIRLQNLDPFEDAERQRNTTVKEGVLSMGAAGLEKAGWKREPGEVYGHPLTARSVGADGLGTGMLKPESGWDFDEEDLKKKGEWKTLFRDMDDDNV